LFTLTKLYSKKASDSDNHRNYGDNGLTCLGHLGQNNTNRINSIFVMLPKEANQVGVVYLGFNITSIFAKKLYQLGWYWLSLLQRYLILHSFSICQIFDTCRISVTRVSYPKRCFIYYWRKCFYLVQPSNFLEVRHVSLRYDKHKKLA